MFLAILFPGISFLFRGIIFSGFVCLLLQLTVFRWIPAALWSALSLVDDRNLKRHNELMRATLGE